MSLPCIALESLCLATPLFGENFLERPTAFGVPLGVLLLFMVLLRAIKEAGAKPQPTVSGGSSAGAAVAPSRSAETVYCPHCGAQKVVHLTALGSSTTCSLCSQPFVASLTPVMGAPNFLPNTPPDISSAKYVATHDHRPRAVEDAQPADLASPFEAPAPARVQDKLLPCPACRNPIRIRAGQSGQTVKCPHCGKSLRTQRA